MIALINKLLDWFKALFWKEEMELTLVGLQYSGKTTFVNVIAVSFGALAASRCANASCQLASGRIHCYPAAVRSARLQAAEDESMSRFHTRASSFLTHFRPIYDEPCVLCRIN